jgi:hypothetical protein
VTGRNKAKKQKNVASTQNLGIHSGHPTLRWGQTGGSEIICSFSKNFNILTFGNFDFGHSCVAPNFNFVFLKGAKMWQFFARWMTKNRKFSVDTVKKLPPGDNPTTFSYNASTVKIYTAMNSVARF